MTRYFNLYLSVPLIALVLSLPNTAKACVFVGGVAPPCSAYWKADAVFTGVVSDITKNLRKENEVFDKLLLCFSVEQAYRGVESAEVEVAAITGTECDTKFQKGERWLVYARRDPATGRMEVWERTRLYSHAEEDLSYIRSLSEGHPESSITVRAFDIYSNTPVQGVRVEVEANGAKYKGRTDEEGRFMVPAVKPGRYFIRGISPARRLITYHRPPGKVKEGKEYGSVEYQEEIKDGRCLYLEVLVLSPTSHSDRR